MVLALNLYLQASTYHQLNQFKLYVDDTEMQWMCGPPIEKCTECYLICFSSDMCKTIRNFEPTLRNDVCLLHRNQC